MEFNETAVFPFEYDEDESFYADFNDSDLIYNCPNFTEADQRLVTK